MPSNLNPKTALLWGGGVVLVLGIIYALSVAVSKKTVSIPSEEGVLLDEPVSSLDHLKGNQEADVILVEYSDFQCPACKSYAPVVNAITEQFGDKLLFAYRHFPLPSHKHAEAAARAAEAADKQGKFWEMHDNLFEKQEEWAEAKDIDKLLSQYAGDLGLDTSKFDQDYRSASVKDKVSGDYQGGLRSGVNGTPSFFLNGKKIRNPRSLKEFQQLIENSIKLAEAEKQKLEEAKKGEGSTTKDLPEPKGQLDER